MDRSGPLQRMGCGSGTFVQPRRQRRPEVDGRHRGPAAGLRADHHDVGAAVGESRYGRGPDRGHSVGPKGRRAPRNLPSIPACLLAARWRSMECSTSWRAAAPSMRATILQLAVDRSRSPLLTVRTSTPLRSQRSMNPSSSIGRRCNLSVCHGEDGLGLTGVQSSAQGPGSRVAPVPGDLTARTRSRRSRRRRQPSPR